MARDFNGDFNDLRLKFIALITDPEFSDDKFIAKLCSETFYKDYWTSERNYFYWKYENYLRLQKPKATLLVHEDLMQNKDKKLKLTIEHIVAQRNSEDKSRIIPDNIKFQVGQASTFDKKYLHSIGNLVIDTQSANSSKGKQNVETKITEYFDKMPYKCQKELRDFLESDGKNKKWTIESINKRKDKLLDFAKKNMVQS